MSDVAAVLDACDPVLATKRSRLPKTSATKSSHNNIIASLIETASKINVCHFR